MKPKTKRKILFFTKYTRKGPSSRYRTYQYVQMYKHRFDIEVFPFFTDSYLDRLYAGKKISKLYLLRRVLTRIFKIIFCISGKDIVFIEYELIPYFPSIFEKYLKFRGVKFILDFDDAIFHNYDQSTSPLIRRLFGNKISAIIKLANHVITGSPYLTKYALSYNKNVTEIPTSLLQSKYAKAKVYLDRDILNIGWVGSKTTSKNIIQILPALQKLEFPYILTLIGFDNDLVSYLDGINYKLIEWNETTEVDYLQQFDVGIMPLEDTPFNRGKCGFKLVQYMACGIPTISSPLETNLKINRSNQNLHADTVEQWVESLGRIYNNLEFYKQVGAVNYLDFQRYYSVESNLITYNSIFNQI